MRKSLLAKRKLKTAARYLSVSASRSKQKLAERITAEHIRAIRMRALDVARQEYMQLNPEPKFQDAPPQPTEPEGEAGFGCYSRNGVRSAWPVHCNAWLQKVELAYDQEPVLSAGMKMVKTI